PAAKQHAAGRLTPLLALVRRGAMRQTLQTSFRPALAPKPPPAEEVWLLPLLLDPALKFAVGPIPVHLLCSRRDQTSSVLVALLPVTPHLTSSEAIPGSQPLKLR
ncbi:hypothetical protein T310_6663, partial [Rasamsonia emersonii CBS 393.64]